MPKIESFDSFEAMLDAMEDAKRLADQQVQPWQEAIKPGDFFIRWEPDYQLMIYGEILDPMIWYDEQPQPLSPDLVEERKYEADLWEQPHMVNLRHTKSYSVLCPSGELGSVHVCTMNQLLTAEQFEWVKRAGWPANIAELRRQLQLLKEVH